MIIPDLNEELALHAAGHTRVAGLDEAGRGAWAGPVCAAAVVLPLGRPDLLDSLAGAGVRDSKQLGPARREALLPLVMEAADAVGVGWATSDEVDELGIVPATRQAMARAGFRWMVASWMAGPPC